MTGTGTISKPVKFYYDGTMRGCQVKEGCYMVSVGPRARAAYFVTGVSKSKRVRSRVNIRALRWPRDEIPGDACVHEIYWYSRKKK